MKVIIMEACDGLVVMVGRHRFDLRDETEEKAENLKNPLDHIHGKDTNVSIEQDY